MSFACGECFLMVNTIVFEAIKHQAIIRAEAIGVDDTFGYNFRSDDLAQSLPRDVTNDPSVDTAIASKQAKYGHFTGCSTTAPAFATTAEVRFVALDFAAEGAFQFALTSQAAADDLVDTLSSVSVEAHCSGSSRSRYF